MAEINLRRNYSVVIVGTLDPIPAAVPTGPVPGLALLFGAWLMAGVLALRAGQPD